MCMQNNTRRSTVNVQLHWAGYFPPTSGTNDRRTNTKRTRLQHMKSHIVLTLNNGQTIVKQPLQPAQPRGPPQPEPNPRDPRIRTVAEPQHTHKCNTTIFELLHAVTRSTHKGLFEDTNPGSNLGGSASRLHSERIVHSVFAAQTRK